MTNCSRDEALDSYFRAFARAGMTPDAARLDLMTEYAGGLPVLAIEIGDALLSSRLRAARDQGRRRTDRDPCRKRLGTKLLRSTGVERVWRTLPLAAAQDSREDGLPELEAEFAGIQTITA